MNTHWIDIFNRAYDDGVVRFVANDLHLIFFPAEQAFIDEDLRNRRGGETAPANLFILFPVICHAAAGAAERKSRTNDGGQAYIVQNVHRFGERSMAIIAAIVALWSFDNLCAGVFEPDLCHCLAEEFPVLSLFNRAGFRANQLNAVFLQNACLLQIQRAVQRSLTAHGGKQSVGLFPRDDFLDEIGCDRFDISGIGEARIGHDRRGIGVYQDNPVAFILQRFDGLHA